MRIFVVHSAGSACHMILASCHASPARQAGFLLAFVGGLHRILGGLIGLGGAEFRLPLLISLFGFAALSAVILNKAMSLVVVASALLFRTKAVPFDEVLAHWPVDCESARGQPARRMAGRGLGDQNRPELDRVLAALLVLIAAVLLLGHDR